MSEARLIRKQNLVSGVLLLVPKNWMVNYQEFCKVVDITLAVGNQLWWKHLHHGNWQMLHLWEPLGTHKTFTSTELWSSFHLKVYLYTHWCVCVCICKKPQSKIAKILTVLIPGDVTNKFFYLPLLYIFPTVNMYSSHNNQPSGKGSSSFPSRALWLTPFLSFLLFKFPPSLTS